MNNFSTSKTAWFSFRCQRGKESEVLDYLKTKGDFFLGVKIFRDLKTQNKIKNKANLKLKNIWPGNIFVQVKLEKGKVSDKIKEIILNSPYFSRLNAYKFDYYADPILFSDKYMQKLEADANNELKLSTGKCSPEDIDFGVNDMVSVVSGAFRGHEGEVTEIDYATGIVTLNFEFFGRITPIKVGFLDCKKIG